MAHWEDPFDFTLAVGPATSPWIVAVEDLQSATRMRLAADGEWTIAAGLLEPCGPDGHAGLPLKDAALILPTAPPGALIAKFGGSTAAVGPPAEAEKPPADAPFLVGGQCELVVAAGSGPLLIGFNTALGRPVEVTRAVKLTVGVVLA